MPPKFLDATAWNQAELLMQPTLIRAIDNIRKHLEQSNWQGTYEDVEQWPPGTSPETQVKVKQLQQKLEAAAPEEVATIQQELSQLPSPYPGYELCLKQGDRKVRVDLWELCYQICLKNYAVDRTAGSTAEVDTSLLTEAGEVDWHRLEEKAKHQIEAVFSQLSAE